MAYYLNIIPDTPSYQEHILSCIIQFHCSQSVEVDVEQVHFGGQFM